MLRSVVFAVLVAVPTALVTWVMARGSGTCRVEGAPAVGASAVVVDPRVALEAVLAAPLGAYTLKEAAALYDAQGLFNYIDGAAPIFVDRGFRALAAAEVVVGDGAEVTADVYDMATPANATAVYAFERPATAESVAVGDEGHRGRLALVFRRGRYYVKLTAFTTAAEAELTALARLIIGRMP